MKITDIFYHIAVRLATARLIKKHGENRAFEKYPIINYDTNFLMSEAQAFSFATASISFMRFNWFTSDAPGS